MRARDHAAVAADAVVVVDDVVAGLEVLEEAGRCRGAAVAAVRWARRRPVRSASASTASLHVGQDEAGCERGDDDAAARAG